MAPRIRHFEKSLRDKTKRVSKIFSKDQYLMAFIFTALFEIWSSLENKLKCVADIRRLFTIKKRKKDDSPSSRRKSNTKHACAQRARRPGAPWEFQVNEKINTEESYQPKNKLSYDIIMETSWRTSDEGTKKACEGWGPKQWRSAKRMRRKKRQTSAPKEWCG